jgi:hypothetical protein
MERPAIMLEQHVSDKHRAEMEARAMTLATVRRKTERIREFSALP